MGRASKLPINVIVGKGIKAIRSSGRSDLEPYAARLSDAKENGDYQEVSKVLYELTTYLDGCKKKQAAGGWT